MMKLKLPIVVERVGPRHFEFIDNEGNWLELTCHDQQTAKRIIDTLNNTLKLEKAISDAIIDLGSAMMECNGAATPLDFLQFTIDSLRRAKGNSQ